MSRSGLRHTCLYTCLAFMACGGASSDSTDGEATSVAAVVVGSSAEMWNLLSLPRGGGSAELRQLQNPDSAVWKGTAVLPVIKDARPLGESLVVLLAEDGRVLRFDPREDRVVEVVRLTPDAKILNVNGAFSVFADSAGRVVHVVTPDGSSRHAQPEAVSWAAAFDGGLALLGASEPHRLRLIHQADGDTILDIETGGPSALLTAWGQRLVVVGTDRRDVRVFATDGGSLVGEVRLGGPVSALGASPSSHEIYAATENPPRLYRVNRHSLTAREVVEFDAPIEELRSSLFGGALLVRTAAGVGQIATGDTQWQSLTSAWRSDLPLGLPHNRTIVLRDDEAQLWMPGSPSTPALAGGAPAWWVPVRSTAGSYPRPGGPEPDILARTDTGIVAPGAAPGPNETIPVSEENAVRPGGHYAIVSSARQRAGVEALLSRLADSGYSTRLREYPDEAGDTWFRGLVGPYPTRARALAAARQLRREHELQAWVTELERE